MEIWDLYDEDGNLTGETWERSRAREIPEGRYHIVCDILIRHRDGEFLLMLRDPDKDIYPGCWEASAGGSALAIRKFLKVGGSMLGGYRSHEQEKEVQRGPL